VVGDVQHDNANGETAFGLHAVTLDVLVVHDVAILGEIPGCAIVYVLWVNGVGRGLDVNAVCP